MTAVAGSTFFTEKRMILKRAAASVLEKNGMLFV